MSPHQWRAIVMVAAVLYGGLALRSHAADSLLSQQPGAALEGRIVTGGDRPIRRAHVVLSGPMTIATDADPDGVFHVNGLVRGTYTITPTKAGFVQIQPARVTVGDSAVALKVTVLMAPAGAITGRVLDRAGKVVADAPVTLLYKDALASQQLTDDRGVFRFHTLRDGTYEVWAQTLDRTEAQEVTLTDARTVEVQVVVDTVRSVTVPEQPPPPPPMSSRPPEMVTPGTGTIRGLVTSAETGLPLADVIVRLLDDTRSNFLSQSQRTEPSGRFIFRDVPDGPYVVTAVAPSGYLNLGFGQKTSGDRVTPVFISPEHQAAGADIALPELKVLSGRVVDEFGDPAPDVTVLALQSMASPWGSMLVPVSGGKPLPGSVTNDLGEFRLRPMRPGVFYITALSGPFAGAAGGGPSAPPTYGYGFAPTFFPGTQAPADAQPIAVENRQPLAPIVFQLVASGMSTVIGRVLDFAGASIPGTDVMLLQLHDGELRTMVQARATTDASGVFHFNNVHAGSFAAQAYGRGNIPSFASGTLEVVPGKTAEIDLRVVPPAAVRGRFVFNGQQDAALLKRIRILTTPTDFVHGPAGGNPAPFAIRDDGTFEVPRFFGLVRLTFDIPLPWTLISTSSAGQDVTDRVFDWRDGDVSDLQVLLAPLATTVSGNVTDRDGRPLHDGFVLIIPQDPARLSNSARYVRGLTTGTKGEFTTTGLPAGAYRAIPFETVPGPMTPDFLATARGLGQGFTLGPGETITLRLEIRK